MPPPLEGSPVLFPAVGTSDVDVEAYAPNARGNAGGPIDASPPCLTAFSVSFTLPFATRLANPVDTDAEPLMDPNANAFGTVKPSSFLTALAPSRTPESMLPSSGLGITRLRGDLSLRFESATMSIIGGRDDAAAEGGEERGSTTPLADEGLSMVASSSGAGAGGGDEKWTRFLGDAPSPSDELLEAGEDPEPEDDEEKHDFIGVGAAGAIPVPVSGGEVA